MTARPSGAFCSPPSPSPSAIGTMPMIIASAVISTGPEPREAGVERGVERARGRRASSSFAKLTTRMLFAVATPMHMIAPVSAGTLIVVCGHEQHPDDAGERRRQRRDDDERVQPRLEVHDDQQVDEHDRQHAGRPAGPTNDVRHRLDLAADDDLRSARQLLARRLDDRRCMSRATPPRSRPCTAAVDVDHRLDVVVRRPPPVPASRWIAARLSSICGRWSPAPAVDRDAAEILRANPSGTAASASRRRS